MHPSLRGMVGSIVVSTGMLPLARSEARDELQWPLTWESLSE